MAKGLGPGKCDAPNCPWRHINDPKEPKSSGTAPNSSHPVGDPPAGMCSETLVDPHDWPERKFFVDTSNEEWFEREFSLCEH